jgi:hypothetical protein
MSIKALAGVLLMISCGKGGEPKARPEPPPTGSGSAAAVKPEPPRTVQVADVPVASGMPFELHDLKVMKAAFVSDGTLTKDTGELELAVTVKPTGTILPEARLSIATTCRTHDVNLAFDEDRTTQQQNIAEVVAEHHGEIRAVYHADPFHDPPQPCELALHYRADKNAPPVVVATACYHDDTVAVGACAPGTFPPVAEQGDLAISSTVETSFKPGVVGITGLFTLVKPLAAGEQLGSTWRCSDGKKVATSKPDADSVVFWTPGAMTAGTSAQGGLTSFLAGDAGEPSRCELTVVARAAKAKPRPLGTFCIDKSGTVARGACAPL